MNKKITKKHFSSIKNKGKEYKNNEDNLHHYYFLTQLQEERETLKKEFKQQLKNDIKFSSKLLNTTERKTLDFLKSPKLLITKIKKELTSLLEQKTKHFKDATFNKYRKEYKKQLNKLRTKIAYHYIKNILLFPIWFIKFLLPSFLHGTPNIWTNLKLIATKREFHPLRMMMFSWVVFTCVFIWGGSFVLKHALPTEAATFNFVQSNWTGGADTVNFPTHTSDRTGWTKYFAKDANVTAGATLSLTAVSSTFQETANADFNAGVHSTTSAFSDSVRLMKPPGASCTYGYECSSSWCADLDGLGGVCASGTNVGLYNSACGLTLTVYATDVSGTKAWKTSNTACDTPQCGLDGGQDGDNLVADNSVDFSLYTARNACKAIGGRLPNRTELACIYTNKASYGNNFQSSYYWSSAENNASYAWYVYFSNGSQNYNNKTFAYYVRCVRGQ